jgi:hemoglobin/transferrin/lactoferrin receptor protein
VIRILGLFACLLALIPTPALAADISGKVADGSGGVLPGTTVTLLNIATGTQTIAVADASGQFRFVALPIGIYRVATSLVGFSESSRTVVIDDNNATVVLEFVLELGAIRAEVTVSADRGVRDLQVVPLRADTLPGDLIRELTPASTGEAMLAAPGVTAVGSGPFQMRPRLRGLDSTRVLVLVDGERLNNARTATDRAGVEVGLVDPDSIDSIEVLGGAGSVLYGTDALSGTINIVTNRPRLGDRTAVMAGFDGYYSSNEDGRRGTVTLGLTSRVLSVSFTGGAERFDNYRAGGKFNESSQALHDAGTIDQADTIDALGFTFRRFPDPFNAAFTRTSAEIGNSGMRGSSANLAAIARLSTRQTLEVRYQRRHAENIGFPDFVAPFFFQTITLPWSRFEKASATYTATDIRPWFSRLNVTFYRQQQDRLLRNDFPVQFPAPTAGSFFPITVFRLNILSDTRQQVWTPGLDVQGTFLTHPSNVLTAGITVFRDRSRDERTTTTTTTQIGRVALGQFGPAATVFPEPIVLGPPTVENPVRVPNARFRDVGLFVHDEWTVSPAVRVTAGLRVDGYRVVAENTPGYSITSTIASAVPAISAATLPALTGETISRTALTGEAGLVLRADRPVSLFAHYVRSYRHPNLEELLFSGPATAGQIVPNITVNPETGHNVDAGARIRLAKFVGSLSYFNNTYRDFISTEIVARITSQSGVSPVSQALNLARVRIQGVEGEATAPFAAAGLTWMPSANFSYNRGTVLAGTNPLTGASLAGGAQDNITPTKVSASLRVGDARERWWASYSVRAQGEVSRVSPLLSDSEFLIAQDLFGLDGFAIHRVAFGVDWRAASDRLGLTFALDNLTDTFYREHFQFAPARGRSFSVLLRVRGNR